MNIQRLFYHLQFVFLPTILALVFALQNYIFNQWLHLSSQYSGRLFFVSFALGLVLHSPSLFFNKKGRYWYLLLVSFLISSTFLSEFIFFEYGQSFLQFSALKYIGQASSVWGTVTTLFSFKLFIFVINVLVIGVAFFLTLRKNYHQIILSKKEKISIFLLLCVIAFFGYYFLVRQEKKEWGNTSRLYKDVYDLNTLVEKVGIINFTLEDTLKYLLRTNLVTVADKKFLESWSKAQIKSPTNGEHFDIDKGKNIIFIQIESLENAVINQKINGQEITPNLNSLVKEGLYFSNYYTQIGPGNTADAEFSTLNSLYPLQDDVVFVDYAQNTYQALPQLLVQHGYHTYALHGDVPTFWNRSNIYPNLGYQQQISEGDYVMTRPIGKGPSALGDEDFLRQSLPKMENFKQPFFSTLITESSHTPFELPEDLQTLDVSSQADLNYTQQQYLESIHYMDKALGEFMDQLKRESFYNNSVIFIYGDHGSYTNISDVIGSEDKTFPALTHSQVPLIILNSGIENGEIKTPASHIDLFPTVVNLVGIQAPPDILGQDILNTENPVAVHRNVISGTMNTILTSYLAFIANIDGIFEKGICLKMPEKNPIPVEDCKNLYTQQVDAVKASDIIVRGNLLDLFLANVKH